ncbi:MAG TPA: hypothetical protein VGK14_04730 [Novimethylophilus sp.]|jgi:hypothetical protein|uniref:hypothetical protein n=1 Tax=Novimethylophilus sp. TaxID=2137426 RepID=UPI002F4259F2
MKTIMLVDDPATIASSTSDHRTASWRFIESVNDLPEDTMRLGDILIGSKPAREHRSFPASLTDSEFAA